MVTRITGLANTGFDTDGTVAKLMQAHKAPIDRLSQTKQKYEWQRDDYRDMNTKITDYRNNKLFNFKLEGNFNYRQVNITGNTTAVSAKATADALDGSLTVKVNTLAKSASKISEGLIATPTFDPSKTLSSQSTNFTGGTPVTGTYQFKINGSDPISVDARTDSLNDVIAKINKNTNVTAFYDTTKRQISVIAKNTGETNGAVGDGQYISFEDVSGNLLGSVMQLNSSGPNAAINRTAGSNASVNINGLDTTRTSNTFKINGIELTLNQEGGASSTVNTKMDTDKIVDAIKGFIKDYNDILKTTQDKVGETVNRDYQPLTDDQRANFTDKQIEQWETKAKRGMLKSDSIINGIISSLRSDATAIVNTGSTKYNSLASIGIETGAYYENGKLYLNNEDKLRAAIEANPDAVRTIFSGDAKDNGNGTEVGVAERMYSHLKVGLDNITKKAGVGSTLSDNSVIGLQIYDITKRVTEGKSKLTDIETSYYNRFSAMESAINRMNAQQASFQSSLGK